METAIWKGNVAPKLGDITITMTSNHLLNGMILQVRGMEQVVNFFWICHALPKFYMEPENGTLMHPGIGEKCFGKHHFYVRC